MGKRRNVWVFCYDVTDDSMRRRLGELLLEHCVRVQGSVYEGRMGKTDARRLTRACARYILPGDSLRVYRLSESALADCQAVGGTPIAEEGDFWLV